MSSSEDELSHFKPSGLLYSKLNNEPASNRMLKYFECEDYCIPSKSDPSSSFKLFVFKESTVLETFDLNSRSFYRLGRDEKINHIHLLHESISSQHAVLQYRLREGRCRLYLMDLDSSNGTMINGEIILEGKRFYEILDGDVVKFGASTRDYVFMKNS